MGKHMKRNAFFVTVLCTVSCLLMLCFGGVARGSEEKSPVPEAPVKGMVTMVDIGAKKCIPCKMMAPILKELSEEYAGKAAIVFIDVWEHPGEGQKFGIKSIPTQIFYDKEGKEVSRHEGFMPKNSIESRLEKMGVR